MKIKKTGFGSNLIIASLFAILFAYQTQAQNKYGFEWIRTYQPYFKIKVSQRGLFKIDSAALSSWNGKDPRKFQLFKNGKEQAIFVSGESDGVFNATDFIEFYGTPNDGSLDQFLYRTNAEQPQMFRSIFSDTGIYFLTLLPDTSLVQPLRISAFTDTDYGNYTPEPKLIITQQIVPQEDYYYGAYLPADEKYYLSEYGDAEGMMSALIGQGQSRYYTFQTPFVTNGISAEAEIKIIGASDFFLPNATQANHHVKIFTIANNQTPVLIIDTTFRGYGEQKFTRSILSSQLGDSTRFLVQVINDIGVSSDFIGVSYIQLSYTRNTLFNGSKLEECVLNTSISGAKTLLQINNFIGSEPILWDLKTNSRAVGTKNSNQAQFLLPYSPGLRTLVLANGQTNLSSNQLLPISFAAPNPNNTYQYLLISNKQLQSSAENYKTYRSNKYKTYLAYVEDLSDYYTYGNFHPLAIRRFCEHIYKEQTTPPQFLLLLGRGYQNNLLKADPKNNALNLVPAIGVPSSDHLFTNGFSLTNGAPAIATGRIPAATNTEANNYLQKIIYLETNSDSIQNWRKHYLHLSGGSYESQQISFKYQLQSLANAVIDKPVGGNVFSYYKSSTAPTDNNLEGKLIGHLNDGVNLMTFYGHGSLTVLDMSFGSINDLLPNHHTAFYYFNGCNIGNANDVDPLGTGLVYGKDYICADAKGAIGWLAHTNFTFTNHLEYQMEQLYNQFSYQKYGKEIGLQIKAALEITSQTNEAFARSHALQLLLQGDPAFTLYSPTKPDYKIANEDLFISPSNASVQNDSLAVGIILHNLAKAQTDTLEIKVTRKLPDNSIIEYLLSPIMGPNYLDTVYAWIKPLLKKDIGNNQFDVEINPSKKIDEIAFTNNQASINYFLPGSGLQAIMPLPYAIISSDTVSLLVQNNNLFAEANEYLFEIDTSLTFLETSPFYRKSEVITANHLAKWDVPLTSNDSMVYYWRAKLNLPESEGGIWVTQSFVHINQGPEGWHQRKYQQIRNASAQTFIEFNDTTNKIEFSNNELVLGIENRRWDHRRMGVVIPYLLNAGVGTCISQGVVVLIFEPFQVDFPYELPNYPFNCAFVQNNKQDQSIRYYPFNTNTLSGEQELARLIDSVPEGYYVAMFSRYSTNIPNWAPSTKTLFGKIGSQKAEQIKSQNTAWAVIGKKGEPIGFATEDTVINNTLPSTLPPSPSDIQDENYLRIKRNIKLKWYQGNFVSAPIGPAQKYNEINLNIREEDPVISGRWWLNVIGVTSSGKDTVLLSNQTGNKIDIAWVDSKNIPFIKLQFNCVDSTYRTPHQIDFWQVSFEPTPELSVDINPQYSFHSDVLSQGDTLLLSLPMINLGKRTLDTTYASLEISDVNRLIPYSTLVKVPPIGSGQNYVLNQKIPTHILQGINTLQINLNASKQPEERTYLNNFYKKSFLVNGDVANPFLEVTFDGKRIMNRDFVSPTPIIRISSTDKNTFLLQKDTSTFELYLLRPKTLDYERVNMNSNEVQFIPAIEGKNEAMLLYQPEKLPDGIYSLKVQAIDASGNKAGVNDYEIDFNVLNKSTISQFYPYPNPFTTQMRFVYTLTGSKIPDQLLIRILTINGKIVREIRKEEFGPMYFGSNVSEFAWDGTDQYGDRLANGVYLYQVFTKIEGNSIENRGTNAKEEASFFVNGTGKIYLMK
jgi:hypothetical protein